MDLNEYHRLWNLDYPESECVRGAEEAYEAYEDRRWEEQQIARYDAEREAAYYEYMEQQHREYVEAMDRAEEERNR